MANSSTAGILLYKITGVTVKNFRIRNFNVGIHIYESNNNIITGNNVDSIIVYGLLLYPYSNNNTVTKNTFSYNRYGVYIIDHSNDNKIYNNNFIGNTKAQIYIAYQSTGSITYLDPPVGGNYWDNFDTPNKGCNDINNDGFCDTSYIFNGGRDNYPWVKRDGWSLPAEQTLDPVIIIPGIVGTELYNGSDLIWMNLDRMFLDINDQFLTNNLNLDNSGKSLSDIQIGNIIDSKKLSILETDIFKSLITDLETNNYQENKNLFFFPYDWRLDLNTTKDLLKQKIDEVKAQTGAQKVNIIAHSMGGLLVKDYLNSYGKENVDKLIFVGTPHLGAPKAAKVLLEGDRFGIPWLEEDRIQEIAQNSPALHELLPDQTYFSEFQGYFRKYSLLGNNLLLNYEETKNFFLNEKGKNPIMFQKAENFYSQNLDNLDFIGMETYNIAGCKTPTQAAYSFGILGEIGQTGYSSGDGTVPMVSADYINIPNTNKYYVKDGNHAELSSTNGVRDLILEILNGNVNNLAENVSSDSSFCNFKGKKLTWHSPVEIHIYSNGRHTGPIENNAIEYGILGIDYDVMGHNKFIFLPTDGGQEYLVEAKGLEEGSFDLSVSEVENGQYLTTQVFNDVPITISTVANFTVSDLIENNILELKKDGEITQITASAVLEGDLALDLTPPETQITLTGKKYKEGEFKKEALINFTATDNDSGVLGTWYSINNNDFQKYTKPFIIEGEGLNNLRYYSVDKAGNNEEIKKKEIIIRKFYKYLRKLE